MKLNNWSVTEANTSPFCAPEARGVALQGVVDEHRELGPSDGKSLRTSEIVGVEGRVITTYSGSVYELGTISPEYRAWLRENCPEWDWRNPITFEEDPR